MVSKQRVEGGESMEKGSQCKVKEKRNEQKKWTIYTSLSDSSPLPSSPSANPSTERWDSSVCAGPEVEGREGSGPVSP